MSESDSSDPEGWCSIADTMPPLNTLFWLAQKIDNRHDDLYHMIRSTVSGESAKTISAGDLALALEQLDNGRNQIWTMLMQLGAPVDTLRAAGKAELADELAHASETLKAAIISLSETYMWDPHPVKRDAAHQHSDEYNALTEGYCKVLARVHEVPGFEHYRDLKKRYAELAHAAIDGPVVVINVNYSRFPVEDPPRADALVVTRPGCPVTHVPLPKFSHDLAEKLRLSMVSYLQQRHARSRDDRGTKPGVHIRDRLQSILSCLWLYVVQPILQAIEQTLWELTDDRIPHVTWCATGPLAFLPLHAAGIYGSESAMSVSDFVVSSYTPNLSMLLNAHARTGPPPGPPNLLIVSQPNTPGLSALPGSVKEAALIKEHFPDACHLDRQDATVARVLSAMPQHAWVHLACHGIQDARDPMRSAFALQDGRLVLSQLMDASLAHADLAVLSACQTATGDHMLPEEATHLAGGMLAIGFRSVVATMWSIGDRDAPVVADAFYKGLRDGAARAGEKKAGRSDVVYLLHDAVRNLRKKVGDKELVQWVSFVHFGI